MFKSEARGLRGRHRVEWEWRHAWGNDVDDDATPAEPRQETMWEAEMWAVWQKEARRTRLQDREDRDKRERD
jgi:hypothetical protein